MTNALLVPVLSILLLLITFITAVITENPIIKKYLRKKSYIIGIIIVFLFLLLLIGVITFYKEIANGKSDVVAVKKDEIEIIDVDISDPALLDIKLRNISDNDVIIKKFSLDAYAYQTPPKDTIGAVIDPSTTWSASLSDKPLNFVVKPHTADRIQLRLDSGNWGSLVLYLYYGADNVAHISCGKSLSSRYCR